MNKVNQLIICSPGGNITAIVQDKVSRRLQPLVAQKILKTYNQDKPQQKQIEQVAFEEKPTNKKAISRLQMTGGEFCGNAILCFGYLKFNQGKTGYLEISGTKTLLQTRVLPNDSVIVQIPTQTLKTIATTKESLPLIPFEGITQVIINQFYGRSESWQKKKAMKIIKNNQLQNKPATGICFVRKTNQKALIKPYVYFKKGTNYQLFKETACGSGSAAVAIYETLKQKSKFTKLEVIQPTGNSLFVTVKQTNRQLKIWIKGKVKILYQGSLNLA